MKRKLLTCICATWLAGLLGGSIATAQQQDQQPPQQSQPPSQNQQSGPIPAYRSPLATAADNGDDSDGDAQQLAPNDRALSGAQYLSLGVPKTRSYWQPSVNINGTADSNALAAQKSGGWVAWGSVVGAVDVHRKGENNDLTLGLTSGGTFSNETRTSNGAVESLNMVDKESFHRWSLTLLDNLNYLPESSFGYGGLGGISLPGGTTSGVGSGFTVGQSILIGQGQNIENSSVAEVDTPLTPRTSLTFIGGYSLLHYLNTGPLSGVLLNYGEYQARGGYNHQVTRKDTVAMQYTYDGIRYGNSSQSIDEHTAQFSYGRTETGRLAFQVSAGPQIVVSKVPITVTTGSPLPAGSTTRISWSLNSALQWQARRTGFDLTYNHGVSGGSGVFAGSLSDTVTGSVTRKISRTFSDAFNAGYSRNEGATIANSTVTSDTFNYVFAGANLTHPIGQAMGLTLAYQMQYQTSDCAACAGPTLRGNVIRHMISFGFAWKDRPRVF